MPTTIPTIVVVAIPSVGGGDGKIIAGDDKEEVGLINREVETLLVEVDADDDEEVEVVDREVETVVAEVDVNRSKYETAIGLWAEVGTQL